MSSTTKAPICSEPDAEAYGYGISEDGAVLLDLNRDRLLKLNAVGSEMWRRLHAGETTKEVIHNVAAQYGVDEELVARDLDGLVWRLRKLGVMPGQPGITISALLPLADRIVHSASESQPGKDTPGVPAEAGASLIFCAILNLAFCDLILFIGSVKWLCRLVQSTPLKRPPLSAEPADVRQIRDAVSRACVWYPRKALCLLRSAVTTRLLKRQSVPARLVIGARPTPFLAHAWVEVDGVVVNDAQRVKDLYPQLGSY